MVLLACATVEEHLQVALPLLTIRVFHPVLSRTEPLQQLLHLALCPVLL